MTTTRDVEAVGLIRVQCIRLEGTEERLRDLFVDVSGYVEIEQLSPRTLRAWREPSSGAICRLTTAHNTWEVTSTASDLAARVALARGLPPSDTK